MFGKRCSPDHRTPILLVALAVVLGMGAGEALDPNWTEGRGDGYTPSQSNKKT